MPKTGVWLCGCDRGSLNLDRWEMLFDHSCWFNHPPPHTSDHVVWALRCTSMRCWDAAAGYASVGRTADSPRERSMQCKWARRCWDGGNRTHYSCIYTIYTVPGNELRHTRHAEFGNIFKKKIFWLQNWILYLKILGYCRLSIVIS